MTLAEPRPGIGPIRSPHHIGKGSRERIRPAKKKAGTNLHFPPSGKACGFNSRAFSAPSIRDNSKSTSDETDLRSAAAFAFRRSSTAESSAIDVFTLPMITTHYLRLPACVNRVFC